MTCFFNSFQSINYNFRHPTALKFKIDEIFIFFNGVYNFIFVWSIWTCIGYFVLRCTL